MTTQERSLWRLARFENGYPFRAEDLGPTGCPVVRIRQLVDDAADFDRCSVVVPDRYKIDNGDLIFSWSGSLAVKIWERGPAQLNQHLFKVCPGSEIDRRWLRWALAASIPKFEGMMHGAAMTHLTREMLKQVSVSVPSVEDQRRIADYLDDSMARFDQVAEARKYQIRLIADRRWSLFEGRVLAADDLQWLPLRRVLHELVDGPFGSAFSSSDYVDDGAVVVRLGNIGFAEYRDQSEARISFDLYRSFSRHSVCEGDILIAGLGDARNHAGRACVAPHLGPAIVKGKCFRGRVLPGLASPNYIALLLSSSLGAQVIEGRGSTRSMINLEIVKSSVLPFPPLSSQEELTHQVEQYWLQANNVTEMCSRQLGVLAERRRALLVAAMNGDIDATTARGVDV